MWQDWQHQKLKRIEIPKANGKIRKLGIPTIADRAWQCLLKYAAEPANVRNSRGEKLRVQTRTLHKRRPKTDFLEPKQQFQWEHKENSGNRYISMLR